MAECDADPVEIRLSVLLVNNIAIAGVSGELFTLVGQRVKEESPYAATMVVTHCNGSAAGYLPDDEAFGERFGERVGYHYYESEDAGLFWSNDPQTSISEMTEELGLVEFDSRIKRTQILQDRARGKQPELD